MIFRSPCRIALTNCFKQVNLTPSIKGHYVPVLDLTRPVKVFGAAAPSGKKAPKFDYVGIERRVGTKDAQVEYRNRWPKTLQPEETFLSMCSKLYGQAENPIYAKADLVEMHWGLVPVEYDEDGARRRRIFHVLRVCPQPGLHLLDLLRRKYFQRKN